MSERGGAELYVFDTHTLYWYWTHSARLGKGAGTALQALEERRAAGLVPAIVIAELLFLTTGAETPSRSLAFSVSSIERKRFGSTRRGGTSLRSTSSPTSQRCTIG